MEYNWLGFRKFKSNPTQASHIYDFARNTKDFKNDERIVFAKIPSMFRGAVARFYGSGDDSDEEYDDDLDNDDAHPPDEAAQTETEEAGAGAEEEMMADEAAPEQSESTEANSATREEYRDISAELGDMGLDVSKVGMGISIKLNGVNINSRDIPFTEYKSMIEKANEISDRLESLITRPKSSKHADALENIRETLQGFTQLLSNRIAAGTRVAQALSPRRQKRANTRSHSDAAAAAAAAPAPAPAAAAAAAAPAAAASQSK